MGAVTHQRSLALTAPDEHGEGLHPQPRHGTVLVWNQRSAGQQWRKIRPNDDLARVLIQHAGESDRFISVNEFDGWRLVKLLRSLRAVYVDIDREMSVEAALLAVDDAMLPAPNYVVQSGRGVHLYWLIDAVPPKVLPVWQAIQRKLVNVLAEVGADRSCTDCTRVLRLVGSTNSKAQDVEVVGYVVTDARWTLRDLANEVLGFREERPRYSSRVTSLERKRADRAVRRATGTFQLWHSRYRDLCLIADHHAFMRPNGLGDGRDRMLFLMSNALSWFVPPDRIYDEIRRIALTYMPSYSLSQSERFTKPIVARALQAASGKTVQFRGEEVDPRYRFRSDTIRDWLGPELLTQELEPQLQVLCSPERLAQRKKARDQARYKTRQADSLSRSKPWEKEGVSRATWYRRQKSA